MAFDLQITIPEPSPAADAISRLAADNHITPAEAAVKLLDEVAKLHDKPLPGEELIGLFSSPEDSALIDEAMAMAQERRKLDEPRDFGL